ncbi:hypothetical protein [Nannocystis radixulma]|uniref:Uncharacterized protein n=1 Tax=Nannocystis radixulma TaxID=2995305 RepID=A0ABT5BCK8_9BACT|nr:hypothetical protein [Nannocystis radixulma]MDC0671264.1 hypothetical protein [Nannocystis radixulma]
MSRAPGQPGTATPLLGVPRALAVCDAGKKKCRKLLNIGVIIEYDEPDDEIEDPQFREITCRIERAIDDALGKGEDEFENQLGWISTQSWSLVEDPDRNYGRCGICGGWVTDFAEAGAVPAFDHGILERGTWTCRDHLPNHHPRGWHFWEYDFASVAGRELSSKVLALLRSSPDLKLRDITPMLLRVPDLREVTLAAILEPHHRFLRRRRGAAAAGRRGGGGRLSV